MTTSELQRGVVERHPRATPRTSSTAHALWHSYARATATRVTLPLRSVLIDRPVSLQSSRFLSAVMVTSCQR